MRAARLRLLSLLLLLAVLALTASCASWRTSGPERDPSSQRLLPAGPVVGQIGQYGSHVWRGIPFARPPVGELRWRAPQPADRWSDWLEADESRDVCVQGSSLFSGEDPADEGGLLGSEDCLTLDVYAPVFEPEAVPTGDARLPVMVWIHGGGNVVGSASFYDGGKLAAAREVIVVAIQYRLGAFGWFRHAALRHGADGPADASGNFGTLDMLRALEWVQENIAPLGGDPGNVTIFGESAGGTDVFSLLLSPLSGALFHRAIVQSGGLGVMEADRAEAPYVSFETSHRNSSSEVLARLVENSGRASDRAEADAEVARMSSEEIAGLLRGLSVDELMAAYEVDPQQGEIDIPTVFRDGFVLPDEGPAELLARGAYHQVPVMLGSNRDENKLFMVNDPEYVSMLFGSIPRARDADVYQATAEHQSRAWKARGVDLPASLMHAAQGDSVYAYRFDWADEPGVRWVYDGGAMIGAAHGLEIPFVFGHFDVGPQSGSLFTRGNREARELLSEQMMSYWAHFAYTGRPGRGRADDLPEWWAWDDSNKRSPKYIVFDTLAGGGLRMDTRVESVDGVVAAVVADERLASARSRCSVLRDLTVWGYISPDEYRAAGSGLCASFAIDAHPWADVETDS